MTKEQFSNSQDLLEAGFKDPEKIVATFAKVSELLWEEKISVSGATMIGLMVIAQSFDDLMPEHFTKAEQVRNALDLMALFMTKVDIQFKDVMGGEHDAEEVDTE